VSIFFRIPTMSAPCALPVLPAFLFVYAATIVVFLALCMMLQAGVCPTLPANLIHVYPGHMLHNPLIHWADKQNHKRYAKGYVFSGRLVGHRLPPSMALPSLHSHQIRPLSDTQWHRLIPSATAPLIGVALIIAPFLLVYSRRRIVTICRLSTEGNLGTEVAVSSADSFTSTFGTQDNTPCATAPLVGRSNRGPTRVFVANLPPSTSWKQLQTHFQRVGQVVFAKVLEGKASGVVEFATEAQAKEAVQVMSKYPLRGQILSVRLSVPPKTPARVSVGRSAAPGTATMRWTRARGDTPLGDPEADQRLAVEVHDALDRRQALRDSGDFKAADAIREELRSKGVNVNDNLRQWSLAPTTRDQLNPRTPRMKPGQLISWVRAANDPANDGSLADSRRTARVLEMLAERQALRDRGEYGKADDIRVEMQKMGVQTQDWRRIWWLGELGPDEEPVAPVGIVTPWTRDPTDAGPSENEATIQRQVDRWVSLRQQRDYDASDDLREKLGAEGVVLDDNRRTWRLDPAAPRRSLPRARSPRDR